MKSNSLIYLTIILFIYSIYDYFDHIRRPGDIFGDHPYHWLAFSVVAFTTFVIVSFGVKYLLEKVLKAKNLIIEIFAVGFWIFSYLIFLGPLVNKLFWPFDELIFSFKFGPVSIILGIYFVARVIINLIRKEKLLYSN